MRHGKDTKKGWVNSEGDLWTSKVANVVFSSSEIHSQDLTFIEDKITKPRKQLIKALLSIDDTSEEALKIKSYVKKF